MSDHRHPCPSPLLPGLVGGIVGAALANASHQRDDALTQAALRKIADLERERLTAENQRHELAQAESQRHESERIYQRAVLWLSHCDNEERLDYLIAMHGAAFAQPVANRLTAEIFTHPPLAGPLAAHSTIGLQLARCQQEQQTWRRESAHLQRRRWSAGGVFLLGMLGGGVVVVPLMLALDLPAMAYGGALVLLAGLSPIVAERQPPPPSTRTHSAGGFVAPAQTHAQHLARHDLLGTLRAEVMARHARQFHAQTEELRRLFALHLPALPAAAEKHLWAVRPLIEAAQRDYPPRVRCELATVSDAAIHARLRPALTAAVARQGERLLQTRAEAR